MGDKGRLFPAGAPYSDHVMAFAEDYMMMALGTMEPEVARRIHEGFMPFTAGSPEAADEMVRLLEHAARQVGAHAAQALDSAARDIADWHGDAADNFEAYLSQMNDAVRLQAECFEALALVMRAYKALLLAAREDIVSLLENIDARLDEAEVREWKIGLAIVNALASTAGGIGKGAGPMGAVMGFISGVIGVVMEIIDGESESEILASMADALEKLGRMLEAELERLKKAFDAVLESMLDNPNLPDVSPSAPDIITGPSFDPREFSLYPQDQPESFNKKVDTGALVPSAEEPGEIGAGVP